jgi:hypothetical protein
MSDETRIMVGLAFISLPTIAFGGYFLLSILKRAAGTEGITETQRDYFRAGHAHAGVLVLLGIVGQLFLDTSRLNEGIVWALRIGLFAAPLLISGGRRLKAPGATGSARWLQDRQRVRQDGHGQGGREDIGALLADLNKREGWKA